MRLTASVATGALQSPLGVSEPHAHARAKGAVEGPQQTNLTYVGPSEDGEAEVRGGTVTNAGDKFAGVGRNALCPCGSGVKFKRCHGAPGGGPTGHSLTS